MNTVLKGDLFEETCYKVISEILTEGKLGAIPALCKVFKKKGYYSRDRQSDIIFDLSIEVWPEGADQYVLLYLIECKDYVDSVPVNKVEDFHSKIQQVTGVNVKGIFITKSRIQEGGYNFAKSKGMMLIEVNENITYNIILHKAKRYYEKQLEIDFKDIGGIISKEFINKGLMRNLDKILIQGFVDYVKQKFYTSDIKPIRRLSAEEIEEYTKQILNYFDQTIIGECKGLPLNQFIKFLNDIYGLQVESYNFNEYDHNQRQVISSCSFLEKRIRIDKSIIDTKRHGFIVCHEIGHFFLHNKILISQNTYEKFEDSQYNIALDKFILENDRNWIEWQANQFAACLLLPKDSLLARLYIFQKQIGLPGGHPVYVDDQRCNEEDFHNVTGRLAAYFGTSKTTIIYRLNSIGMIKFNYRIKSVGQILQELMST